MKKINRQSIRKAIVFSTLLCALSLSLQASRITAPKELVLDPRITKSSSFSILAPRDSWAQQATKRTDSQEQWRGCATGISNTPGGWDAYRASNLAASKHYAEAIEELTKAISCYDTPGQQELAPELLLRRAKLYTLVGLNQQAMADIKKAITLKRCNETEKFQCAQALIEYGEYADAESILTPTAQSGSPSFRGYYYYLLGIAQEKQGKTDSAIESFKQAATFFASSGMSAQTQACLDAIAATSKNTGGKATLSIANLTPPKSNSDKIQKLITTLMTQADIFDMNKLKELIGATEIKEINTGYFISPYEGRLKELHLITIDKLPSGGLRLRIYMEPALCAMDVSAFTPYARDKITAEQTMRPELGHCEGFKVPSGTIIFSMLDQGFKPIQCIDLYSRDAQYPQPTRQQPNNPQANQHQSTRQQASQPQATTKADKNYYRILEHYWGRYEQLPQAEKLVQEWVKEEPESPQAHLHQAEVLASQGKYDEALKAIETAKKFQKTDDGLNNKYSGDILTIKRGSYLLEQGKYKEALAEFSKGFPNDLTPDHLLMRGRAELGVKNYTEAAKDLKAACEQFYSACRIIKRDETQKLLQTIPKSTLPEVSRIAAPPTIPRAAQENQAFLEEQKRQTIVRMKALEEETQKKKEEKEQKDQEAIAKAQQKLSEAKLQQAAKPDQYIFALLNMASIYSRQQKTEDGKKYLDQALDCYESYTPRAGYDSCTRALVSQISSLKDQEFDTRLDRVIKRSELFCQDEKFRIERDRFILDLSRYRSVDEVNLLDKLIKMREQMQSKTGASTDSLYRYISGAYERKKDEKQAIWALEKAISNAQTNQARSRYHIDLAQLFLRKQQPEAAKKEWQKAVGIVDWQNSWAISGFTSLAQAFCRRGDRATCKEILSVLLTHANTQSLRTIDNTFTELIESFETSREYTTAETLLTKRIEAGLACGHDNNITEWQMQLSELYLMTDRQAKSEILYKQARESAFFRGDAVETIDLRRKRALLRAGHKPEQSSNSTQAPGAKSITFPHVFYAFSELSLNGNTSTGSYDSRQKNDRYSFLRPKDENGDVCSPGKISITGNASVAGTIYCSPPRSSSNQTDSWRLLNRTQVVHEALMQPNSLIITKSTGRTNLGDYNGRMPLAGGDYEATSVSSLYLQDNLSKPVRIFITDDNVKERYALKLGSSLRSNLPENLQIYYLGYRPMVFEHNSDISAIVYAPYSQLTMGDNNCQFHGAIVADKITTIGNVTASYDKALQGRVFTPSQP